MGEKRGELQARLSSIPNTEFFRLEEEISSQPLAGVGFGPMINDLLLIGIRNAAGAQGVTEMGRAIRSLAAAVVRAAPFCLRTVSSYGLGCEGRVLFSLLSSRPHVKGLVLPVIAETGIDGSFVIASGDGVASNLPAGVRFVVRKRLLGPVPFRSVGDVPRALTQWLKPLAGFSRRHGLPQPFAISAAAVLLEGSRAFFSYRRILTLNRPLAVVVEFDRNASTVPLVLAAKALGIPTLTFQHGMINSAYGYTPLVADRIMVWGRTSRDQLIDFGVPADRMVVTGCPVVSFQLNEGANEIAALAKTGESGGRPCVVLATTPISVSARRTLVSVFCDALQDDQELELAIKLHPSEALATYRDEMSKYPGVRFLDPGASSMEATLREATVVVCHNTGFGLEAIARGKPVVILDAISAPLAGAASWVVNGGALVARNGGELRELVTALVADDAVSRRQRDAGFAFAKSVYAATGPRAARAAGAAIRELIGGP